jgi:uncharacterized membrane protein
MINYLKTNDKWDIIKILLGAIVVALLGWGSWISSQAYKVATNEKSIQEYKDKIDKNNEVLHRRITKESDKREEKLDKLQIQIMQLNSLLVEILIKQNTGGKDGQSQESSNSGQGSR